MVKESEPSDVPAGTAMFTVKLTAVPLLVSQFEVVPARPVKSEAVIPVGRPVKVIPFVPIYGWLVPLLVFTLNVYVVLDPTSTGDGLCEISVIAVIDAEAVPVSTNGADNVPSVSTRARNGKERLIVIHLLRVRASRCAS